MVDKTVNYKDSQNDVISTHTHVLFALENMIRQEMPNCSIVYDHQLSYETAIKQFYVNNDSEQDPLPLFAYMRGVSRPAELTPAKRGRNYTGVLKNYDGAVTYGASYDEFDVNFAYFTKSVEIAEKFEVTYNSDEGITGTKELIVNMGDLGDFKYFITYEELTDIQFEFESQFYKSVAGTLKIRGFYFTFRSTSGIIKEINERIMAVRDINKKDSIELLSESTLR